jgi:GNAT superfamily N-acetyltransferase
LRTSWDGTEEETEEDPKRPKVSSDPFADLADPKPAQAKPPAGLHLARPDDPFSDLADEPAKASPLAKPLAPSDVLGSMRSRAPHAGGPSLSSLLNENRPTSAKSIAEAEDAPRPFADETAKLFNPASTKLSRAPQSAPQDASVTPATAPVRVVDHTDPTLGLLAKMGVGMMGLENPVEPIVGTAKGMLDAVRIVGSPAKGAEGAVQYRPGTDEPIETGAAPLPGVSGKEKAISAAQIASMALSGPVAETVSAAASPLLSRVLPAAADIPAIAKVVGHAAAGAAPGAAFMPDHPLIGGLLGGALGGLHAAAGYEPRPAPVDANLSEHPDRLLTGRDGARSDQSRVKVKATVSPEGQPASPATDPFAVELNTVEEALKQAGVKRPVAPVAPVEPKAAATPPTSALETLKQAVEAAQAEAPKPKAAPPSPLDQLKQAAAAPKAEPGRIDRPDAPMVKGKDTVIRLGSGEKLEGHYAWMPEESVVGSHDPVSFKPNPELPPGIQNRPYHGPAGKAAREQIQMQQANPDFDALYDTGTSVESGPTVVTPQGVGVAGFGRDMTERGVPDEKRPAMLAARQKAAIAAGVPAEAIQAMPEGRLVRVLSDPNIDVRDPKVLGALNIGSDRPAMKSKSAASEGASRATALMQSPESLTHFASTVDPEATLSEYLGSSDGTAFVRSLIHDGVIGVQEVGRFIDPRSGTVTADGRDVIKHMMYSAAIPNADVLDQAPKVIKQKLEHSIPSIVTTNLTPGYELGPLVEHALALMHTAKATTGSLESHLAQGSLLGGEEEHPAVVQMARFIEGTPRAKLTAAFRQYGTLAKEASGQAETHDMFGGTPATPAQLMKQLFTAPTEPEKATAVREHAAGYGDGKPIEPTDPFADLADTKQPTEYDTPAILAAREHSRVTPPSWKINTPERQEQRQAAEALHFGHGAEVKGHTVTFLIGTMSAGKTTIVKRSPVAQGALVPDTDAIKKQLEPEYQGGKGSSVVQKEASQIRNNIIARAKARGDNLVIQTVGEHEGDLRARMQPFIDAGWTVHLKLAELPAHKAVQRAIKRYEEEGGHFVDPGDILDVGDKPRRVYEAVKHSPGIHTYERYDSDTEHGEPPRLVERGSNGTADGEGSSRDATTATGRKRGHDQDAQQHADLARPALPAEDGHGEVREAPAAYHATAPDGSGQRERFYSRLERAITNAPFAKGTAEQWKAALSKNVAKGEREWTGVDRLLDENAGKVLTRSQVQDVFDTGKVELKESLHDDSPERQEQFRAATTKKFEASASLHSAIDRVGGRNDDMSHSYVHSLENGKVTPKELTDNVRQRAGFAVGNTVANVAALTRAGERYLRALDAHRAASVPRGKFGQYTEPGGTNYREIVVQLDNRPGDVSEAEYEKAWAASSDYIHTTNDKYLDAYQAHRGDRTLRSFWSDAERAHAEKLDAALTEASNGRHERPDYESNHWDEKNPLLHLRLNDRTLPNGEKVLHVEEVQSDWHQQGREKGYAGPDEKTEVSRRIDAASKAWRAGEKQLGSDIETMHVSSGTLYSDRDGNVIGRVDHEGNVHESSGATRAQRDALDQVSAGMQDYNRANADWGTLMHSVPDAPMKKTEEWMGLAMKRVIDEAVKGGYDRVAWTTGDQQAARYDLSKQVDKLTYNPKTNELRAYKNGSGIHEGKYDPKALASVIGKEAAEKLLAARVERSGYEQTPTQTLEGKDLVFGGHGMKTFYDQMIPNWVKDYGKKMGVKLDIEPVPQPDHQPEGDPVPTSARSSSDGMEVLDQHGNPFGMYYAADAAEALEMALHRGPTDFQHEKLGDLSGNQSFRVTPELRQHVEQHGQALWEGGKPFKARPVDAIQTDLFGPDAPTDAFRETDPIYKSQKLQKQLAKRIAAVESDIEAFEPKPLPGDAYQTTAHSLAVEVVHRMLRENKAANLIGAELHTHADLAAATDVLRNPVHEVFHFVPQTGAKIDAISAISSRMAGSTAIFIDHNDLEGFARYAVDLMVQHGSNAFSFIHNHPNGIPTASPADINVTPNMVAAINAETDRRGLPRAEFRGHLIKNHRLYNVIRQTASGSFQTIKGELSGVHTPDPFRNPTMAVGIGHSITDQDSLLAVAQQLEPAKNNATMLWTGGEHAAVSEIGVLSVPWLADRALTPKGRRQIRDAFFEHANTMNGAVRAFLVLEDTPLARRVLEPLMREGIVTAGAFARQHADGTTSYRPAPFQWVNPRAADASGRMQFGNETADESNTRARVGRLAESPSPFARAAISSINGQDQATGSAVLPASAAAQGGRVARDAGDERHAAERDMVVGRGRHGESDANAGAGGVAPGSGRFGQERSEIAGGHDSPGDRPDRETPDLRRDVRGLDEGHQRGADEAPRDVSGPLTRESLEHWSDRVKDQLGLQHFNVHLSNAGDLRLSDVEVPKGARKQGIGTEALQRLTDLADHRGLRVTLTPGLRDDRHGTTSRSRLIAFYKRFGFVLNKGRNKDFAISDLMYREPKASSVREMAGGFGEDLFGEKAREEEPQDSLFGDAEGTDSKRSLAATESSARGEIGRLKQELELVQRAVKAATEPKLLAKQAKRQREIAIRLAVLEKLVNRDKAISADEMRTRAAAGENESLFEKVQAYHGTPHKFDTFSLDHIGSGEGAQAYGWGLYFAGKKAVAEYYREKLAGASRGFAALTKEENAALTEEDLSLIAKDGAKAVEDYLRDREEAAKSYAEDLQSAIDWDEGPERWRTLIKDNAKAIAALKKLRDSGNYAVSKPGHLYHVEIPDSETFLHWDDPVSEQPADVRRAINTIDSDMIRAWQKSGAWDHVTGESLYNQLQREAGTPSRASAQLRALGVNGIKYADGTSRGVRILPAEQSTSKKWVVGPRMGAKSEQRYFDNEKDARAYYNSVVHHNYVVFDDNKVVVKAVSEKTAGYGTASAKRPAQNAEDRPIAATPKAVKAFWKWFGDSKTVDAEGRPLVLYHGTAADFDTFDPKKGNIESDMGAGLYFTNTPEDVSHNYAGIGPDMENKIERLAERIMSDNDGDELRYGTPMYRDAMARAKAEATQQIGVEHDGAVMPSYVKMEKPFVIGGDNETHLEMSDGYNHETDEYDSEPSGPLNDFIDALRHVASRYDDGSVDNVIDELMSQGEGLSASEVMKTLKDDSSFGYYTDDNGDIVSNEIVRQALERAGFDGIIDHSVDEKFGSQRRLGKQMQGMHAETVHYIAFQPEQIKSATGNSGTFNPQDASVIREPGAGYGTPKGNGPIGSTANLNPKLNLNHTHPTPDATGLEQQRPLLRPREIVPALMRLFNPEALGPEAKGAAGTIRHQAAERFHQGAIAAEAVKELGKAVGKLTKQEAVAYWEAAEKGRSTGSPLFDAGNKVLHKITEQRTAQLIAFDRLKADAAIENYIGRFWSKPGAKVSSIIGRAMGKRPLEGPKSFLKHRSLESFTDGLDAGLIPATYNYVDAQLAKIAEMDRLIGAEKMLRAEKKAGRVKVVMLGKKPPVDAEGDDWVRIGDGTDAAFNIYGPSQGMVKLPEGANVAPDDVEVFGPRVIGHYYAPKNAAAVWNNHLSKGIRGNPLVDAYMAPAQAAAQLMLGVSGFHATVISTEGMISDLALAIDSVANEGGSVAAGAKQAGRAVAAPVRMSHLGSMIGEEYRKPGTHPELAAVMDAMKMGGFRYTATSEFWTGERKKNLERAFNDAVNAESKGRKLWGAARLPTSALYAGIEALSSPIMAHYVPNMKAGATYEGVAQALAKMPPGTSLDDMHRVIGDVVKEMDYRFGQVNYDNHFINATMKHIAQMVFLAPGWTFGTAAEMGRGLRDVATIPAKAYRRGRRYVGGSGGGGRRGGGGGDAGNGTPDDNNGQPEIPEELIGRSAAYWIGAAAATMLINGVLTYIYTGEQPHGKDYWAFRDGTTDNERNPNRHRIPGYIMNDVYGWSRHPVNTAKNKLSPALAFMERMANNRTYYGDEIYNPDDDFPTKAKQVATEAGKSVMPLSIQNFMEGKKRGGEKMGRDMAFNAVGINPPKREFVRTPALNKLHEYLDLKGHDTRTPEQVEKSDDRRTLIQQLKDGVASRADVHKLEVAGELTRRQEQNIRKNMKTDERVLEYRRLSDVDQMRRVYALGSDDEKRLWWPFLNRKIHRMRQQAFGTLPEDQP